MPVNTHCRRFSAERARVGSLIDGLASEGDELWPREWWPAMELDGPPAVGASGGHGPIRYEVEWYEPGEGIWFCFSAPAGFDGGHGFFAHATDEGTVLEHRLEMRTRGWARLSWPFLYGPFHDALMDDAMWKAGRALDEPAERCRWSLYVRTLRWILGRRRGRTS